MTYEQFYVNATPKIRWELRTNPGGALTDAGTSVTCAIYNEAGELVSATATESCTNESTGKYYYNGFTVTAAMQPGIYKAIATITDSGNVIRNKDCVAYFEVIKI